MELMLSLFHYCLKDIKTKDRSVTDQTREEIFCQECGRVLKERIVTRHYEKNVNFLDPNYSRKHTEQSGKSSHNEMELFRGVKNN